MSQESITMTITNARIVCKDEVLEGGSLRLENGRIAEVSASPLPGPDTVDAEGAVIMPGFIDIHIHGCAGTDFMDAEAGDYRI